MLSFLNRRDLEVRTSLSRSTIYRLIKRGDFPRPVRLSPGRVAWSEKEISDWLDRRATKVASSKGAS